MPPDEIAELRGALKALQDAREEGDADRAESALERAADDVSRRHRHGQGDRRRCRQAARAADDNGTTRLEVRDQGITHRRWFEVTANGEAKWGDR